MFGLLLGLAISFQIPSAKIDVPLYYSHEQSVCDAKNSACFYNSSENNVEGTEEKVIELNENTPVMSEGTSEDTYDLITPTPTPAPKRHKSEGENSEKNDYHGCNGHILTWNAHKKKRSSFQSSSSDSRGQNSNGKGNGRS